MKGLIALLGEAFEAQIAARLQDGLRMTALAIAATLLFVSGFVALMIAVYQALAAYMPREGAALIIAVLFILAGAILLLAAARGRRAPPTSQEPPHATGQQKAMEEQVLAYVRENAKSATVLALLAGTAVGASPELRKILLRELDKRTASPPQD